MNRCRLSFLHSIKYNTDSGGCAVVAPKSSGLVRGQYLDGWPLSCVLSGASNRWARGRTQGWFSWSEYRLRGSSLRGNDRLYRHRFSAVSLCPRANAIQWGVKIGHGRELYKDIVVEKDMRFGTSGCRWHREARAKKKYTGEKKIKIKIKCNSLTSLYTRRWANYILPL